MTARQQWSVVFGVVVLLAAALFAATHFLGVIRVLNERLGIPQRLSLLGVTRSQLPALAKSSRGNSMDGNPRDVSDTELLDALEQNW